LQHQHYRKPNKVNLLASDLIVLFQVHTTGKDGARYIFKETRKQSPKFIFVVLQQDSFAASCPPETQLKHINDTLLHNTRTCT